MIVKIDKTFVKDSSKITDRHLLSRIADCIEEVQKAESITSIHNLKKLKGGNKYFRIRIGDYRLGIEITNSVVEFVRCLPRKDIYKYFPK